jgi:hypothetical protein
MNKAEYAEYEARVKAFFEREGLECLSSQPLDFDAEESEYGEPYFSWSPCDCCGDPLGGNREDMCGYNPKENTIQKGYSVCSDCVYYLANGCLPDSEMPVDDTY